MPSMPPSNFQQQVHSSHLQSVVHSTQPSVAYNKAKAQEKRNLSIVRRATCHFISKDDVHAPDDFIKAWHCPTSRTLLLAAFNDQNDTGQSRMSA